MGVDCYTYYLLCDRCGTEKLLAGEPAPARPGDVIEAFAILGFLFLRDGSPRCAVCAGIPVVGHKRD